MKPQKIIILRHGESEANVDSGLYAGKPNHLMVLTPKGREQCAARGKSLKPVLDGKRITVWSSPYARSRETAEIVMAQIDPAGIRYREDPRLREQDWGNFYTREEAQERSDERKQHSYFFYRIAGGESGADVYDRISTFLESLHRDFNGDEWTETILISSHGITSLIFLMRFYHWSYEEYDNADWFDNCDYVILDLDANTGRYRICDDHRTRHAGKDE